MKKRENKFDMLFLFTGKKLIYIFLSFVVAVIIHNFFYALFGFEEAVFFIIAVIVIPIYLITSLIYTLISMIKQKTLFEKGFLLRSIISIILGVILSFVVIWLSIFNYSAWWILSIIFSFALYYLLKVFTNNIAK
jgi:hypothetical protein